MFKFLALFFLTSLVTPRTHINNDPDRICGKWESADKKLIVQIYKSGTIYRGKMVWFKNQDNSKAMDEWTDKHNPDPALRNRKLIGMDVLNGMTYNASSDSWEDGKIYEAQSGKEWNAAAKIDKDGVLKVTGYWHLKFIGKTMLFNRVP